MHLWVHSLAILPEPSRLACLSADELARAGRFAFERDRRRYLAARCALRERLAQHIGVAAKSLRIVEGPFGKPCLAEAPAHHFNVSHSEAVALIGISDASEIGVDIETLRPISDAVSLAQSHFTPSELASYMASDDASKDMAFLCVWTRKEACLKAIGTGLSVAPSEIDVGLGHGLARLCIDLPAARMHVEVRSLAPSATTLGAVARVVESNDPVRG